MLISKMGINELHSKIDNLEKNRKILKNLGTNSL